MTFQKVQFATADLTLRRKLLEVAKHGHKEAREDPNFYDRSESEHTYFQIGPNGRPYSDAANACEAGRAANEKYAEELGGKFIWHSGLYEDDSMRTPQRGWLYIRFEPNQIPESSALVEAGSYVQ